MIPMFLGLTFANFIMLGTVFVLGVTARDQSALSLHVLVAVGAGLMTTLAHCAVFTYFMGTTKWLGAATDKGGLDEQQFVEAPSGRKKRSLFIVMTAIMITMLTMFGGAATDTIAWWPAGVHMVLGIATLVVNVVCAVLEYQLIRAQGGTMDKALEILNATPGLRVETKQKNELQETTA